MRRTCFIGWRNRRRKNFMRPVFGKHPPSKTDRREFKSAEWLDWPFRRVSLRIIICQACFVRILTRRVLNSYKPVELKYIFLPLREEFEELFAQTFKKDSNAKYLNHIMTCFMNKRWKDLIKLMKHVEKSVILRSSDQDTFVRERYDSINFSLMSQSVITLHFNLQMDHFVPKTVACWKPNGRRRESFCFLLYRRISDKSIKRR